ncbi:hypothetical protein BJ165DRAFT_1398278 [Panaeolus papilionaceus]|nr:hypothetical protein BJ165DRAFT_1398278 [Panaeolus papilionaceus]
MPSVRRSMTPVEGTLEDHQLNYIVRRALHHGVLLHSFYNIGQYCQDSFSGSFRTCKLLLHPAIGMLCRERSFCSLIEGVDYETGLALFWHNIDNRCSWGSKVWEGSLSDAEGAKPFFIVERSANKQTANTTKFPIGSFMPFCARSLKLRISVQALIWGWALCTHMIRLVREVVDRAKLNEDGVKILRSWGSKIHRMLVLDRSVLGVSESGYEDYEDLLVRFADPRGVFAGPEGESPASFSIAIYWRLQRQGS